MTAAYADGFDLKGSHTRFADPRGLDKNICQAKYHSRIDVLCGEMMTLLHA